MVLSMLRKEVTVMDREFGYLKTNGYKSDIEDRYTRQCAAEGRYSIVVRFRRYGQADIEWDYMTQAQLNALTGDNQEIVKIRFREIHEKYSTSFLPVEHYSVITGNGKITGLTHEAACKAASEINVFLSTMLHQYEQKRSRHE